MGNGLIRLADWPERLHQVVEAARHRPFEWGTHDCCLFPADAALAMTGVDIAESLRGKCRTEAGAIRFMRRWSGGGVEETFAKVAATYGLPEVPPAFAGRGDVVLHTDERGRPSLGVCLGRLFAAPAEPGLSFHPMAAATRAWRI